MIIGEMIMAWREKKGLTRRSLARVIGIDHVTLSRIENNDVRSVSITNINKILVWATAPQK
jgi:transcriptional regulator with XRE-family HTH domain